LSATEQVAWLCLLLLLLLLLVVTLLQVWPVLGLVVCQLIRSNIANEQLLDDFKLPSLLLLLQVWPVLDPVVCQLIRSTIEPLLDDMKPPFIAAMGFQQLTLGELPVELEGIRVIGGDKQGTQSVDRQQSYVLQSCACPLSTNCSHHTQSCACPLSTNCSHHTMHRTTLSDARSACLMAGAVEAH
jgi:hypothetical protein